MIGDLLRAERERQNLSIKDIEKGTSIRSLYIEAIEKGEYKTLPGEVYTKGFIRNYANFLKMDADVAVKQFNEERHPDQVAIASEVETKQTQPAPKEVPAAKKIPADSSAPRQQNDFLQRVESSHHRQTFIMGVVAVLVVLAGAYFLLGSSDEPQSEKTQSSVTQQAVHTPAKQQAAQQSTEKEEASEVKVAAKFTGRCWISVKADGKTLFEGTVEKGETKEWTADQRLDLTAGNAGAVTLSYNGEDQGVLGKEGEVVEKTYRLSGAEDAAADKPADKKKK